MLTLLPSESATALSSPGGEPDRLFRAGRFAEADRAYARLLRANPADAHALARRGRIALLANRFERAERFLTEAIRLAPGDAFSKRQLAECHIRQDDLPPAVPLLQGTGDQMDAAEAVQYASVTGAPYRLQGAQQTRLPFVGVDPLPSVRASVNGGEPQTFLIDTGGTLALSTTTAERAGLRAVSTSTTHPAGQTLTTYHGVMPSFGLGDITLGTVPVVWYDLRMPNLPDGTRPAGVIGTTLLYHFIATMDYAEQALVLRRKTAAQARQAWAEAAGRGAGRLPLWLAKDHVPCTLGSVNDYGPGVASVDTGGMGLGILMTEDGAKRAGVEIDYDHPQNSGGMPSYPITPARISLGRAVGRNVPGVVGAWPWLDMFGFETVGNFTHEFFRSRAITFDYAGMNFYVTA
ncbi:Tetratricopeptide repeat-containing protein [Nonomuraea solani]|uniref:Tetratricopeptide repeat-containing protein n=2 Tax=Nonomuraea solani TaxID=1144553 RepID=A0A1H5Y6C7_9ACTN|nr:Tetratricopeptide repeat-containing protein [Nonomuraea solani]